MREEQAQIDTTDEVSERAERLVEVEEQLADAHVEDSLDSSPDEREHVDLTSDISYERVVAVDKQHGKCKIKVSIDGAEQKFTLPWPADTTDGEEPLVRLCNHANTPIHRIADLDRVPVLDTERGHRLYIPHPHRTRETTVTLPGGRAVSWTRTRLTDRVRYRFGLAMLYLTSTPALKASHKSPGYTSSDSAEKVTAVAVVLGILPLIDWSSVLSDPSTIPALIFLLGVAAFMAPMLVDIARAVPWGIEAETRG